MGKRSLPGVYDVESNILHDFSRLQNSDICVPYKTDRALLILDMLRSYDSSFVDNSSHSSVPPDFFSAFGFPNVAFEVYRVNDSEGLSKRGKSINRVLTRERELAEGIRKDFGLSDSVNIYVSANPGDGKYDANHNYENYVRQHKRVAFKHIETMLSFSWPKGYGLRGCFVFDESDVYVECVDSVEATRVWYGGLHVVDVHHPVRDKRFMYLYLNCGLDFLVWYSPYKRLPNEMFADVPWAWVLDLSCFRWDTFPYRRGYAIPCMRSF